MTLEQFLKEVDCKEKDIISYSGEKALEIVRQNGYALKYVKEQTEEICLEAVKQNLYAIRVVDKSVFKEEYTKESIVEKLFKLLGIRVKR